MIFELTMGENAWEELDYKSQDLGSEEQRLQFRSRVTDKLRSLQTFVPFYNREPLVNAYKDFCNSAYCEIEHFKSFRGVCLQDVLPNFPRRESSPEEQRLDKRIQSVSDLDSKLPIVLAVPGFFGGAFLGGYITNRVTDNPYVAYGCSAMGSVMGAFVSGTIAHFCIVPFEKHFKKQQARENAKQDKLFYQQVQEYLKRTSP